LADTPQPRRYHAEGDVAAHTRLAVAACPPDGDPDLLWAALLHDVGKPGVTEADGERVTSHGHARVGAEIADRVLERLEMPSERRKRIVWVVRQHTFHLSWNLTHAHQASRRHRRLVADPRFPLLLELLRVDCLASLGNPRGLKPYEFYERLWKEVRERDQ
jgi:putative nucleotidyltransferase with HDIG domain